MITQLQQKLLRNVVFLLLGLAIIAVLYRVIKPLLSKQDKNTSQQSQLKALKNETEIDKNETEIDKNRLVPSQYNTGYINAPKHSNTNQCDYTNNVKLSYYYNKPTDTRPIPEMTPGYMSEYIPDDCSCLQFVISP